MFKAYRVGTLLGVPIKIDVTFLLVLPVFAWLIGAEIDQLVTILNQVFGLGIDAEPLIGGARPWLVGLLAALGLFVGVLLHELGHSVVAMYYDYDIKSITLWLLGGVAQPAELPRNWWHEFWIAIVGPIVSVVIGITCYLLALLVPAGMNVTLFVLTYLAVLNVALAGFNMLPAFPLDGGRVLRAILGRSQSYVRATRQAAAVGKFFAVLLGLGGLFLLNFFWIAIALFVYIAAAAESRQMMLDALLEDVAVADVMTPAPEVATVPADLPVSDLLDRMFAERHTGYPVVEDGEVVGVVTLEDVRETHAPERDQLRVGDLMTSAEKLVTVRPDDDAVDVFRELADNDIGRLLVTEPDGELAGIVTRTDLMTAIRIARERELLDDRSSDYGRSAPT